MASEANGGFSGSILGCNHSACGQVTRGRNQYTLMAAGSDAMAGALEVYSSVKQNRDKVPGLNVATEEMAVFFQRSGKKSGTTLKQAVNQ